MSQGTKDRLRVVIAGEVDHGKSTILGRLLCDTGNLPAGKIQELEQICRRRGTDMEWSFLLDAFQAERDQAVTIDTTQVGFSTANRDFVMIDAPGHVQFLKNMMSGAGQADAAILVVDAAEGVQAQTLLHVRLLSLLGLRQIIVAVNKMDAVDYSHSIFTKISKEIRQFLQTLHIKPACILPLAARHGGMIVRRCGNMNWYKSKTLVEALEALAVEKNRASAPLRFAVQDVYRFEGRRIVAGRVESGILRTGDELLFSPYNQQARVESIEVWPMEPDKIMAGTGEVVGITLSERIFVERGHIAAPEQSAPPLSPVFKARIFWLSQKPLKQGDILRARFGLFETVVSVQESGTLECNTFGEIILSSRGLLPVDNGNIVLENEDGIVAAGVMTLDGFPDRRHQRIAKSANLTRVDHLLGASAREDMNGHKGGVFWLTGLSGSGKSTLAMQAERALFERGLKAYVLDGDNIRLGLNKDLGFSPEDRAENIRRVSHVAALMADAGLIVITAFISPYRADREQAQGVAGERFHEIHIQADLETCESRDPKGLYKKARSGKITEFTGIDSPYEAPESPDLTVDTQGNSVEQCVRQVLDFILYRTSLSPVAARKEKIFVVQ